MSLFRNRPTATLAVKRYLTALVLILSLFVATHAQTPQSTAAPEAASESAGVTEKGFRNRVFEIKHRDPVALLKVLRPLGSGFRGSEMSATSQEFRTISVRDFPENLAMIDEAIRRLDVPEPPSPGIELHVHLLVASNDAGPSASPFPPELVEVVRQLPNTLGYRSYTLMSSQVLRTKAGARELSNKGVADFKLPADNPASRNPIFFDYEMRSLTLDAAASGPARVQLENFQLAMRIPLMVSSDKVEYEQIGFRTPVSLRDGERVVVGTTTMADKSIVVVLTANVSK